jgi:hypothetical protein
LAAEEEAEVAMTQGAPGVGDAAALDRFLALRLLFSAQNCILIGSLSRQIQIIWID